MATGTATAPSDPGPSRRNGSAPGRSKQAAEYERYIEAQLNRTRRQVKAVDLAGALLLLATGSLAYLLLVALADHWLFTGGLGFWGRAAALAGLLLGVSIWLALRLLPLVVRRINPVYAAQTIEQSRPSLKNSLINFLLLRSRPGSLPPLLYEAVEQQAANRLSAERVETVVDRSGLIKLGWVLIGVLLVFALYKMISPKDPLQSMGRVIAPWADLAPPTRVAIRDVQPGNTQAFHDQHLKVTAEISGVNVGEPVTIYYSTADGQLVNQPLRMTLPHGSNRYSAQLPDDAVGLQQDLAYRLQAGDAISDRFQVQVVTAPSIAVETVDYQYPAYTQTAPRRVERQGDLQALEGTRVTISATTNDDIRSAYVDFDCDGRRDLPMQADGRRATVSFMLALKDQSDLPRHESYQLRFTNPAGHENPKPTRHTIEVLRDLPPEIALVEPQLDPKQEHPLPRGAKLRLSLQASDPDFKLSAVKLHARRGTEPLFEESLLAEPRGGQFRRDFMLDSGRYGLADGDLIELWASAEDNKQPTANRTETPRYSIRIVPPEGEEQKQDQLAQADQQQKNQEKDDKDSEKQDGNAQGGQQKPGEKPEEQEGAPSDEANPEQQSGDGQPDQSKRDGDKSKSDAPQAKGPQGGSSGDQQQGADGEGEPDQESEGQQQPSERVDPQTDPGKAFEEVLKHRQQQQNQDQQQDAGKQNAAKQDTGSEDTSNKKDGQQHKQDASKPDASKPDQPGSSEKQAAEREPMRAADEQQPVPGQEPNDAQQPEGAGKPGEQQPKKQQPGGQPKSGQEPSQNDQGTKPEGDKQEDARPDGVPNAGQQQPREPGANDQPPGEKSPSRDEAPKDAEGHEQPMPGEGGKAKGQVEPNDSQAETTEVKPGEKPSGGDPEPREKGESGAGAKDTNQQGSPAPQEENAPRDKKQAVADGTQPEEKDEPQSPSTSKTESDSQSDTDGDRSGNGSKGGGQPSKSPGTGSPGQNTEADQGSGEANEKGAGPTGAKGGNKAPAGKPTDDAASADEKGPGSKSRPGDAAAGGKQAPDGQLGDAASPREAAQDAGAQPSQEGQEQEQPRGDQQPGDQPPNGGQPGSPADGAQGAPDGNPASGGLPRDENAPPPPRDAAEPGGDDPNLEYAREATDLALEYLEDQLDKDQPDQELLDKLKWSREDMEQFVKRWEQMKAAAREPGNKGQEARQELDDTLESLGLRPRRTSLEGGKGRDDRNRNLRESIRTTPPPEYADQYREFSKGTARRRPQN